MARVVVAHNYLAQVMSLHRRGKTAAARDLLALYRLAFVDDPLPGQHAAVAEKLRTK